MSVSRLRLALEDSSPSSDSMRSSSSIPRTSPPSPAMSPDSIPITPRRRVGAFTVQYASRSRTTSAAEELYSSQPNLLLPGDEGTANSSSSSSSGVIRTNSGPFKSSKSSPLGGGESPPSSSFEATTTQMVKKKERDPVSPSSQEEEGDDEGKPLFCFAKDDDDEEHPPIIELEPPTPDGGDKNLESPFGSFISNGSSTTSTTTAGCGLTEGSSSFRTPSSLGGSMRKTPRHAIRPMLTFRPDLNRKMQEEQVKLEKGLCRAHNQQADARASSFLAGYVSNINELGEVEVCNMKYRLLALIACSHHFQAQLRTEAAKKEEERELMFSQNSSPPHLKKKPSKMSQGGASHHPPIGSLVFTRTLLSDVISMFDHCMRSRDVRSPQEGAAIAFQHTVAEFNKIGLWRLHSDENDQ